MTVFTTQHPEKCGVVVANEQEIVVDFHEKKQNPISDIANAAVYIFDPEVFSFARKPFI